MDTKQLPRELASETRRHVRVSESARFLWHVRQNGLVGQGRVRNISASGMQVELDSADPLPDQSIFSFDFNLNDTNYMPDTGRLVWRRKKTFSNDKYFCGFEFTDISGNVAARLNKRIAGGVRRLVLAWRAKKVTGFILASITIALVGYAAWLVGAIYQDVSRSNQTLLANANQQADLTREYQRLYADTTRRLADVTLELNQTTALYQQVQDQLATTQQELSATKSALTETQALLAQAKSVTIPPPSSPMESAQIALPADAVHSISDGKNLLASYRDRIREVTLQINQIKYKNQLAKISALAERDRLRLLYGNQGYFIKSGQAVQVDPRQYQAENFNTLAPGKSFHPDSKVRVNVTVFQ